MTDLPGSQPRPAGEGGERSPAEMLARRPPSRPSHDDAPDGARAFEDVPEAVLTVDAAGRCLDANPSALLLLGYSKDALLRMRIGDLIARDASWVEAELGRLARRGYWHDAVALCRADGGVVDAESTATLYGVGETSRYIVVLRPAGEAHPLDDVLASTESRLAAAVDSAAEAIVSTDARLRIIAYNAAAERMFGRPAREVVGRDIGILLPESSRAAFAADAPSFGSTRRTPGEAARPDTIRAMRGDGTELPIDLTLSQAGDGDDRIVTGILRDASSRVEAEKRARRGRGIDREAAAAADRARSRTERLQTVTAALGEALTTKDVTDVLLTQGLAATGAAAGIVVLHGPGEQQLSVSGASGYPPELLEAYLRQSVDARLPGAEAFRTASRIWVEGREEMLRRYPDIRAIAGTLDTGSLGALPLTVGGETIGALALHFPRSLRISDEDRQLVLAIVRQCAQAMQRARLFEEERRARDEAERAWSRSARLQRVTSALADARDEPDVVAVMLREAMEALGAAGGAFVRPIDDEWLTLVDSVGYPSEALEQWERFPREASTPISEALSTRRLVVVESEEERVSRFPTLASESRAADYGSAVAVPLSVAGETLGALGLQFPSYGPVSEDDRALLLAIARQSAQALRRAQLDASERESEARLRRLVESNVIGTLVGDAEWIIDANDALLSLLGYDRRDLGEGKLSWRRLTPEEHQDRDEQAIREALEHGAVAPYEKEYVRKDGTRVPVLIGIALLEAAPFRAVAFVLDLTERKAAERDRLRLLEQERAARRDAEVARERLAFLADASDVLNSSLDYTLSLQQLADTAVPRLGDWCAVDVLDERGDLNLVAVAHVDPNKVEFAKRLRESNPPDPDAPYSSWAAIKSRRPQVLREIPPALVERAVGEDPAAKDILDYLQLRSVIIVPLVAGGRAFGALTLVWAESDKRYGDDDVALAQDLARRSAVAIEHARLYEERRRVADILEQSLRPPAFPEIAGVQIAGRYLPAGDVAAVGGDFYDVFAASDGTWVAALGDVCGKGARAAAVMALARYTIRTAALTESRPSGVLALLNDALLRQTDDQRFCTVVSLNIAPSKEGIRITSSSGGHPLPLIVGSSGDIRALGEPGTLLGVFPDPTLADDTTVLRPGESLVLYTDGVTDERDEADRSFGEGRLRSVLRASAALSPDGMADAIEDAVKSFNPDRPRDDIAILVLRAKS
jgi:PAS domain S-box-containing protein